VAGRARALFALPRVHGFDARRRRGHIGLGETIRKNQWGRDRKYVVAFLSSGSPQRPLAEFVVADDYEETRDLVAVIRGSDGGRRMYGAGDALPRVNTEGFRTQLYSERVSIPASGTRWRWSRAKTMTKPCSTTR
jgi:hypothetical protein